MPLPVAVAVEASKGAHLLELSPEALAEEAAEHAAEGGAHAHEHEDEDSKTDPHVWLAPENAKVEMNNIKEALIEIVNAHGKPVLSQCSIRRARSVESDTFRCFGLIRKFWRFFDSYF